MCWQCRWQRGNGGHRLWANEEASKVAYLNYRHVQPYVWAIMISDKQPIGSNSQTPNKHAPIISGQQQSIATMYCILYGEITRSIYEYGLWEWDFWKKCKQRSNDKQSANPKWKYLRVHFKITINNSHTNRMRWCRRQCRPRQVWGKGEVAEAHCWLSVLTWLVHCAVRFWGVAKSYDCIESSLSVSTSSLCCGGYVFPLRISICCFRRQLAVNGSASNLARLFVTYRRYERVNDNDTDGLKEYAHICMGRFLFAFKCSGGFEWSLRGPCI